MPVVNNIRSKSFLIFWSVGILIIPLIIVILVWLNLSVQRYPEVGINLTTLDSSNYGLDSALSQQNASTQSSLTYLPLLITPDAFSVKLPAIDLEHSIEFKALEIDGTSYDANSSLVRNSFKAIDNKADFDHAVNQEAFLHQAINSNVELFDNAGHFYPVQFTNRDIWSTSVLFWLHPLVAIIAIYLGMITLYIGGRNRYHFINLAVAFSLAMHILLSVSAFDRRWAIDPDVICWSFYLSNLFLRLFIFFTIYILWNQPYKIGRLPALRLMPWVVLILMVVPWGLEVSGVYTNFLFNIINSMLFGSTFTILAICLQCRMAYSKPSDGVNLVNQIAMKWLLGIIAVCTSFGLGFHALYALGVLKALGSDIFDASVAIVFMIGVTALLLRTQLFKMSNWWWQAWSILGAVSVSLLVYSITVELTVDLSGFSFVLVAFFGLSAYFVIGALFRSYYAKQEKKVMRFAFPHFVDMVGSFSNPSVAHGKWCDILSKTFNPKALISCYQPNPCLLDNDNDDTVFSSVCIDDSQPVRVWDDGASLLVLGFNGEKVLLKGASSGMRLFTDKDVQRVQLLWRIASQGQAAQNAYIQGEVCERAYIANEIRENIGKKLIKIISVDNQYSDYSRDTLQNLDMLTNGLYKQVLSMAEILADINYYFAETCEIKSIQYLVDIDIPHLLNSVLSSHAATFFSALLNELLRNALQHHNTTKISLTIRFTSNDIVVIVINDGDITDPAVWQLGLGITSIKRRIGDVSGDITWTRREGGGVICQATFNQQKWLNL